MVHRSGVRVRRTPAANGRELGTLPFNRIVLVSLKKDTWVQHRAGWSMIQNASGDPVMTPVSVKISNVNWERGSTPPHWYVCHPGGVRVRAAPSLDAQEKGALAFGDVVEARRLDKGWIQIPIGWCLTQARKDGKVLMLPVDVGEDTPTAATGLITSSPPSSPSISSTTTPPPTPPPLISSASSSSLQRQWVEGWLKQRGQKKKGGYEWKDRYCILLPHQLQVFKAKPTSLKEAPRVGLNLTLSTNIRPDMTVDLCFSLESGNENEQRQDFFICKNPENFKLWMNALIETVFNLSHAEMKVAPVAHMVMPSRMEGFLSKKGAKRTNWKKRYVVLDGPNLMYFENKKQAVKARWKPSLALGTCELTHNAILQVDVAGLAFGVMRDHDPNTRKYIMRAEEKKELEYWVDAIDYTLKYLNWLRLPGHDEERKKFMEGEREEEDSVISSSPTDLARPRASTQLERSSEVYPTKQPPPPPRTVVCVRCAKPLAGHESESTPNFTLPISFISPYTSPKDPMPLDGKEKPDKPMREKAKSPPPPPPSSPSNAPPPPSTSPSSLSPLSPSNAPPPPPFDPTTSFACNLIRQAEQEFALVLKTLNQQLVYPVKVNPSLKLDPKVKRCAEILALATELGHLLSLHRAFTAHLGDVSDMVIAYSSPQFFAIYGQYCRDLPARIEHVKAQMKANKAFQILIEKDFPAPVLNASDEPRPSGSRSDLISLLYRPLYHIIRLATYFGLLKHEMTEPSPLPELCKKLNEFVATAALFGGLPPMPADNLALCGNCSKLYQAAVPSRSNNRSRNVSYGAQLCE